MKKSYHNIIRRLNHGTAEEMYDFLCHFVVETYSEDKYSGEAYGLSTMIARIEDVYYETKGITPI